MRRLSLFIITILLVFSSNIIVFSAATPPDIIHSYVVTVDPQSDGSLNMKYDFDYEATTDFPSNIQYLEIGVANSNFEIIDYSPKDFITNAKANKSGASQVHLDFASLPVKGDRFQFSFVIKQSGMIYKVDEENVSFKFIPGWFDFAKISELKVTVNYGNLSINKVEPASFQKDNTKLIWTFSNLEPNQKADPVIIVTNKSAFPNITESSQEGSGQGSLKWLLIIVLIIIVVIVIIGVVAYFFDDYGGGGYSGGGYTGGFFGSSSSSGGGRSSGGGGSFSGRGSSCACVSSCACACACAGGGRVGCAERGFQVLHWFITGQKKKGKCDV